MFIRSIKLFQIEFYIQVIENYFVQIFLSFLIFSILLSYRILVRAISYTAHGLIPASCVFADRYNREEVVRSLGKEIGLNPPLTLGQLPDTPEELLKLDQVNFTTEVLLNSCHPTDFVFLYNYNTFSFKGVYKI